MSPYKQLTYEQRCQIEALKKNGLKQAAMAPAIGVRQSTLSRELIRNAGFRGYRPKPAQAKAQERRRNARKASKMTDEIVELVERQLREQWSPEQVSGWWQVAHGVRLSHECLYLHIWDDKRAGGDLYTPCSGRARSTRRTVTAKPHEGASTTAWGLNTDPASSELNPRICA
jgi:IS30 family transposase